VVITATECNFIGGAWYYGHVYDENTMAPIDGATVEDDTGESTTSFNEANQGNGYYNIWVPGTATTLTASNYGYGPDTNPITPVSGPWTELDFTLPAGMLTWTPSVVSMRADVGTTTPDTEVLTVENTGGLAASYSIIEYNVPYAAATERPWRPDTPTFQTPNREEDKEAWLRSIAPNNPDPGTAPYLPDAPILTNGAGDLIEIQLTGVPYPWGIGYDKRATDLAWVSDLLLADPASHDSNREILMVDPWSLTLNEVFFAGHPAGADWFADMAYDYRAGKFWQVAVGGTNCIYEWDPNPAVLDYTGASICPAFGTSMRGLAYDPVSDTFFAGTWNGDFIVQFNRNGDYVGGPWEWGWGVSGLAYNPATGHLFALANGQGATDTLVLNAAHPDLLPVGIFESGLGSSQAGLALDCDGHLLAVQQSTDSIFVIDSGETGVCELYDIPWLEVSPMTGTVPPDVKGLDFINLDAYASWNPTLTPGSRWAQLNIDNDTNYGSDNIGVFFTVAFLDVSDANPYDDFIHAMAGAGIPVGCGAGNFCPGDNTTRAQMAVWILKAKYGADYVPPAATGLIFDDVSPESYGADYIEELYGMGIVGGCGGGNYCPNDPVLRQQMPIFMLGALHYGDAGWTPPTTCTGVFADVTSGPYCPFIEEMNSMGIVGGCGGGNYCPLASVTREQMSVFTVGTFSLPYGP
jgi:hypothetical protein